MATSKTCTKSMNHHSSVFKPHLLDLSSSLNHLRTQDTLTDVTIVVETKHFRAHKAVLAACSPYFMAMFTSGFQESTLTEVNVKEGTSETMEQLLDFAYTGMLNLSQQSLIDILTMASYLQMKTVISYCIEYLEEQMLMMSKDLDASLLGGRGLRKRKPDVTWGQGIIFQVYLVADQHEIPELKEFCWKIFVKGFVVLSRVVGFRIYVTAELLDRLLDRPELIKPPGAQAIASIRHMHRIGMIPRRTSEYTEEQVLEAVVSWLTYDWQARKSHAGALLMKVRLGVVPVEILKRLLGTDNFMNVSECKALIDEVLALRATVNPTVPLAIQRPDMFRSRGTITALLATGGEHVDNNGLFAQVFNYNNSEAGKETVWAPLMRFHRPQPICTVNKHTMATLDQKLYLAGGWFLTDPDEKVQNIGDYFFVYDILGNTWQRLRDMPCGREKFAMVKIDNLIYTAGGWAEAVVVGTEWPCTDMYVYDLLKRSWDEIESAQYIPSCDPFAIVHHGKILMYGHGAQDGLPSDHVYYDEDDDAHPGAMSMDEQRHVPTSVHTLQMYDPPSKRWYELMRERHHVHTVHGENKQYSCLVVRNDKCYRVVYDKVRDRHCWISKPRVHELILDLESGAPSATVGKEEEQPWLPEYHVPGAFCIDREIYVNVNGCIVDTGEQMPVERPDPDKVNFSKWLGVDTPGMANAAVATYTFDHYNLMV